jgi:hypothetical protein
LPKTLIGAIVATLIVFVAIRRRSVVDWLIMRALCVVLIALLLGGCAVRWFLPDGFSFSRAHNHAALKLCLRCYSRQILLLLRRRPRWRDLGRVK